MPRTKPKPAPGSASMVTTTTNGPPGEVLTLSEAAAFLRVREADVLRLVNEQALPARQLGDEWRFLKAAIERWLGTGSATPESRKQGQLALAGKYKDDPDLAAICKEAYRQRGRPLTEDE